MIKRALPILKENYRLAGVRGVVRVLASHVYDQRRFVRFRVDLGEWQVRAIEPGVEAREGRMDELARYRTSEPVAEEFWDDQHYGVQRFYLGLIDGEIGHISWVYTHRHRTLQITLQPGEIELNGAYTVPRFRGRRLLAAVETAILNDAKREGLRTAYTHVRVENAASLRGVTKTGFRAAGTVTWRRLFGVSWFRFEPTTRPDALLDELAPRPSRQAVAVEG